MVRPLVAIKARIACHALRRQIALSVGFSTPNWWHTWATMAGVTPLWWPVWAITWPAKYARVRAFGLTPGVLVLATATGAGGVLLGIPPNPPTILRLASIVATLPVGNALLPPAAGAVGGLATAGVAGVVATAVAGAVWALFLAMVLNPCMVAGVTPKLPTAANLRKQHHTNHASNIRHAYLVCNSQNHKIAK